MSRDYKNTSSNRQKPAKKDSPFFSGLLVGLLLGVGISVGMALIITDGESPFVNKVTPAAVIEAEKNSRPDAKPPVDSQAEEKPRFDFYTILPGSEKQVTEQEIKQSAAQPDSTKTTETYFLQVGAFQTEQEADNMKAKLALQGLEAIVQTAEIPDKGTWHRVRVGPFSDLNQINVARSELVQNGFSADLIKVNSNIPNQ